ncbi:hypothetical protein JHV675_52880 [Mycobacterium avium subsp. hominissuis]
MPERLSAIVSGIAEGCVRAGCALLGGETARTQPSAMPLTMALNRSGTVRPTAM